MSSETQACCKWLVRGAIGGRLLLLGDPQPDLVAGLARSADFLTICNTSVTKTSSLDHLLPSMRERIGEISDLQQCDLANVTCVIINGQTQDLVKQNLLSIDITKDLLRSVIVLLPSSNVHIWKTLRTLQWMGNWFRAQQMERECAYGVIPSLSSPRFFLNLSSAQCGRSGALLYNPDNIASQLKHHMLSGAIKTNLVPLLMPVCIVAERQGSQGVNYPNLSQFFAELFDVERVCLNIHTGHTSPDRKTCLQILSVTGQVLGYAKISDTPMADKLIDCEASTLRRLGKMGLTEGRTPLVLFQGTWTGCRLSVQSPAPTDCKPTTNTITEATVQFLGDLFRQSLVYSALGSCQTWIELCHNIDLLKRRVSLAWGNRLARAQSVIEMSFGTNILPWGIGHRDFIAPNTLLYGRQLYVFDWEYATPATLPGSDLFHFVVQGRLNHHNDNPQQIIEYLLNDAAFLGWMNLYGSLIGFDVRRYRRELTLYYFLDISVLYLSIMGFHLGTTGVNDKLAAWSYMIDQLLYLCSREC